MPAGSLSIERAKQTEIDNWGENKLQKVHRKKTEIGSRQKRTSKGIKMLGMTSGADWLIAGLGNP